MVYLNYAKVKTIPVRIFFDHQVFSLQEVGGASRYFFELIRQFATHPDVETNLFLGINQAPYEFEQLPATRARIRRFPALLHPGMYRYAVNEALQTGVAILNGRFDIYHPTYFRSSPVVRARRTIVTHHDCTYEEFPHLFKDAARVIRFRSEQLPKADRIICISEASRRRLLQYYPLDPARTCVIHHGLNQLCRSAAAARELRSRVSRSFLLYVGARGFHKNFVPLLHAFRESRLHDDFELLALGGGPLMPGESQTIASLGLQKSVRCLPFVTDELLAEAYAAATMFVYPSLSEGFGMPPLEAMAAGCPVATSNVTAIPEVCRDAPTYFDPYDASSIAAALVKGVSDSEARERAIARGREVASGYSWEKCGAATLAAYRTCL